MWTADSRCKASSTASKRSWLSWMSAGKHPQMPLHSRSSMRFRNARSGLFERYCDPSSASPVTVGAATNRRLGCQACGARTEQSAPPRRIFLVHDDEKRAARDRHWQPVKFGDPRLAPRVDGVGFPRAPSLEFLLVHHSEVKPGGADARFRRARMIPRCGPGGSRCPSPISN